jgi:hypothetical protein
VLRRLASASVALTLVTLPACPASRPPAKPAPTSPTSSTANATPPTTHCPAATIARIEALRAQGELRHARAATRDLGAPCEAERRALEASLAAELGDVTTLEALAKGAPPSEQQRLGLALAAARSRANDRYDDLFAQGLAARRRGEPVAARASFDRAMSAAERAAGGRFAITPIALGPATGVVLGAAPRYVATLDFLYEIATGRIVYAPGTIELSADERRALRMSDVALTTAPWHATADQSLVSLLDLSAAQVLIEEPIAGYALGRDASLTTLALPLARNAPRVTLFDGDAAPEVLDAVELVDLDTVVRCSALLFSCLRGPALVSADGTTVTWISREAAGDVVHVRRRGQPEGLLREPGARVAVLVPSEHGHPLGLAWSNGIVRIHDGDKVLASHSNVHAEALGMDDDGKRIAWVEKEHLHVALANGQRLALPLAQSGCGPPNEITFDATAVWTYEVSGDIACQSIYDLRTKTASSSTLVTPGDEEQRASEEAALARKLGGGVKPPLLRSHGRALVVRGGHMLVVDEKTGKERSRLASDEPCDLGRALWSGDVIACGSAAGPLRVFSASSGKLLLEGPPPAPAAPMSLAAAEQSLRCALGAKLLPLALCESDARDAGMIAP